MFFRLLFGGLDRPWWIAALVVWVISVIVLRERGIEPLPAGRLAVLFAAAAGLLVFALVRKLNLRPPEEREKVELGPGGLPRKPRGTATAQPDDAAAASNSSSRSRRRR